MSVIKKLPVVAKFLEITMSTLIEEAEVSAVRLSVEMESAVIQHSLDEEESIYVIEDGLYPFWITVNTDSGLINFRTHTNFKSEANQTKRLEICNEINMTQFMVTAYVVNDRLWVDHAINYRDGLLRQNFIRVCRLFAKNIECGIAKVDPEHKFVLPPGRAETESQEE